MSDNRYDLLFFLFLIFRVSFLYCGFVPLPLATLASERAYHHRRRIVDPLNCTAR